MSNEQDAKIAVLAELFHDAYGIEEIDLTALNTYEPKHQVNKLLQEMTSLLQKIERRAFLHKDDTDYDTKLNYFHIKDSAERGLKIIEALIANGEG